MGEAWKLQRLFDPGMTRADLERARTCERMARIRKARRAVANDPLTGGLPTWAQEFFAFLERSKGWKRDIANALWLRLWWHDEQHMPKPPRELIHGQTPMVSTALAARLLRKFGVPDVLVWKCSRHVKHNDCRPTSTGGRPCASAA